MKLLEKWQEQIQNYNSQAEYNAFWNEYIPKETGVYKKILNEGISDYSGTIENLASDFQLDPLNFMGFLDGVNSSLKTKLELDSLEESSEINFSIDFEKLLFNMYEAKADWLFNLEEWSMVLSEDKIESIEKSYKESKIFKNDDSKVGRNDPCPCGSGRKYKKCCINK